MLQGLQKGVTGLRDTLLLCTYAQVSSYVMLIRQRKNFSLSYNISDKGRS